MAAPETAETTPAGWGPAEQAEATAANYEAAAAGQPLPFEPEAG